MQLTITVTERSPGIFTFRPVGSIDATTSSLLEEEVDSILKGSAKTMAFDMEGVNYISSAGIRVILKAQKSLTQRNGQFLMSNLQPQVKKVFEIINALPMMKVYSNMQELDRYLDAMQRKMTGEDDE